MKRKQYKVSEAQVPMFNLDHPNMPVLDVSRCEARLINYETAARMVETYHYAHRVPSIVVAVGMFVDGVLAGVCTYGSVLSNTVGQVCGDNYKFNVLELTRLFIFDWCGRNTESWLIGQSIKLIPKDYFILVSYADAEFNHIGYIYQATNWLYTGKTERIGYKDSNGDDINERTIFDPRKKINDYDKYIRYEQAPKHRYIYFLGSKKQRRILRQALKWPILPYPKGVQHEI
jgi:hypothetical protein